MTDEPTVTSRTKETSGPYTTLRTESSRYN